MCETKKAIDEIFPVKKVTRRQAELIDSPWLSLEIIKAGQLRDALQKKFIISGLVQDHVNYKKQRNKVNRLCRNAKKKNLNADCRNASGDSKKMWKVINKATNKKPKPNTYPDFIEAGDAVGDSRKVRDKLEKSLGKIRKAKGET